LAIERVTAPQDPEGPDRVPSEYIQAVLGHKLPARAAGVITRTATIENNANRDLLIGFLLSFPEPHGS